KVVLLQLNGVLTEEEFKQAFDLAVKGCMEINRIQRETLRSKYLSIKGEEDEDV
ncbi:exosome complex exonuclease Rrp41, partial [Candidatus Bathyarchaeota archaeon]